MIVAVIALVISVIDLIILGFVVHFIKELDESVDIIDRYHGAWIKALLKKHGIKEEDMVVTAEDIGKAAAHWAIKRALSESKEGSNKTHEHVEK